MDQPEGRHMKGRPFGPLVKLPKFFITHHAKCDPAPVIVRERERFVWVRRDDPALSRLRNAASEFLERDEGPEGALKSARATLLAIDTLHMYAPALIAMRASLAAHLCCLPQLIGTEPVRATERAIQSLRTAIAIFEGKS